MTSVSRLLGVAISFTLGILIGGITGGTLGYLLQYYVTVWQFPINVAGRPLHSWPMYIVITFELTVLFAAFAAV